MIKQLLFLCFLALAFAMIAIKSMAVAQPDERLAIFRLGQLLGVCGPGRNLVVPFIDRVIRVKVERIAGWRELSEGELRKKVEEVALRMNV
jgi:regulator of protease activity HflC (stomatin/prohibitin superfamily)